jgi:phage-related protein/predicted XRE-type DNA-binding protein
LRNFPDDVRREFGKAIFDLQKGAKFSMPVSRPMPSVAPGVEEFRVRDRSGAYRVFYFTRMETAVLIFHAFEKKTAKTPPHEIEISAEEVEGDAMKKVKPVVARNAKELAKALGLTPADGVEIQVRSDLNDKIIEVVNERSLTHSQVAKLAHTSRTRVTAVLNRNTHDISTDLMLRILASLGVQARIQFRKAA